MAFEAPGHALRRRTSPSSRRTVAIVEELISGVELRSPSVQLRVLADRRGRAALDPRPAARRPERAELSGLPVPRGLRATPKPSPPRPGRSASGWPRRACSAGSPSTSSWSGHRRRVDALRHRDQPAQGRHDPPVPDAAVPHRRAVRPADRALPHADRARRSTWSRPTTSSPTSLRALSLDDLFDIVARHGLHFDQARQTGVVFHMISCLTEHGRVGLTAVGDTPAEAEAALPTGGAHPARRSGSSHWPSCSCRTD